jgi:hypothetical protein
LPVPHELQSGSGVILYSGNWGIAHEEATFIEAYTRYARQCPNGLKFWLNATGTKADHVEQEFRARGVQIYRSKLVPLDELPRLLKAVDVHLVTLRDTFVGYVLPSKIHACIESGKRILFIGSEASDVHRLASQAGRQMYSRVAVGDVGGLVETLHALERSVVRNPSMSDREVTQDQSDRNQEHTFGDGSSAAAAHR